MLSLPRHRSRAYDKRGIDEGGRDERVHIAGLLRLFRC